MIDVTAAIILRGDKLLIARRRRGDANELLWELPGGKIEPGETPEMCLARELQEELGIHVEVGEFFGEHVYTYPHATIRLMVYRVRWEGDLATLLPLVHDKIDWVPLEGLGGYTFSQADRPFIEELTRDIRSK